MSLGNLTVPEHSLRIFMRLQKIPSTHQVKIHNASHMIKSDQVCKETEYTTYMVIHQSTETDPKLTDGKLTDRDNRTIIRTVLQMLKKFN